MSMLRLGLASLWSRRGSALLTVLSIAVGVALLLAVEATRGAARAGFASTVSGIDLVVGARGNPLDLLLYSVFRVGNASTGVSQESFRKVAGHRDVAFAIPLQLGDSHRGHRVLGTTGDYFTHYRHGEDQPLRYAQGRGFRDAFDVVLGADVARALGYAVGARIEIAHGLVDTGFARHREAPFVVTGILAPTGTPVDRTLHVGLDALEAVHHGTSQAAPATLTAFLVGMRDRRMALTMQRALNEYRAEPLLAILPGVVLAELWELLGVADRALRAIAIGVAGAGLLGMLGAILASLRERRREMAILRTVGASPRHLVALLASESVLLAVAGAALGVLLAGALSLAAAPLLQARFGILPVFSLPGRAAGVFLLSLLLAAAAAGALAGWRAARASLARGLAGHD